MLEGWTCIRQGSELCVFYMTEEEEKGIIYCSCMTPRVELCVVFFLLDVFFSGPSCLFDLHSNMGCTVAVGSLFMFPGMWVSVGHFNLFVHAASCTVHSTSGHMQKGVNFSLTRSFGAPMRDMHNPRVLCSFFETAKFYLDSL